MAASSYAFIDRRYRGVSRLCSGIYPPEVVREFYEMIGGDAALVGRQRARALVVAALKDKQQHAIELPLDFDAAWVEGWAAKGEEATPLEALCATSTFVRAVGVSMGHINQRTGVLVSVHAQDGGRLGRRGLGLQEKEHSVLTRIVHKMNAIEPLQNPQGKVSTLKESLAALKDLGLVRVKGNAVKNAEDKSKGRRNMGNMVLMEQVRYAQTLSKDDLCIPGPPKTYVLHYDSWSAF